jgi:hypothetical protein
MSDVAERVKEIVVEHLGVDADKVVDGASFIDLKKNSAVKFLMMLRKKSRPSRMRLIFWKVLPESFQADIQVALNGCGLAPTVVQGHYCLTGRG